MENIRNFCIIAHIDHGKSTLADRFLETTGTIPARRMKEQYLDQLELERERGITIKMAPVRMPYILGGSSYVLNLIDTPGHSDFSYEVSRALMAVEGAILLIDASQGIQAQTLANLKVAEQASLKIIGVLNKIDLFKKGKDSYEDQRLNKVLGEAAELLRVKPEEIFLVSGRTGEGTDKLLEMIIEKIPPPKIVHSDFSRALIFDSFYDNHRGVIASVRIFDGDVKKDDEVFFVASRTHSKIKEIGFFTPELKETDLIKNGEIGYVATGVKDPEKIKIGDTMIINRQTPLADYRKYALPGYEEPNPVVFVSFYPEESDDHDLLKKSLQKLRLNDSAISVEPESNEVLGRGFKLGFLGKLHFEITAERLKREFNIATINTFPSVRYKIRTKTGWQTIVKPEELPADFLEILEPLVRIEIILPSEYLNNMFSVQKLFRMRDVSTEMISRDRIGIKAVMPLAELVSGFDDQLKSATQGYASFSYEFLDYTPADIEKVDILLAGNLVPGLSRFLPKERVEREGRQMVKRLKEFLPRQQFSQAIQAVANNRVIAREDIQALKKDVTGYLYGGDRTRKMKLWQKQKKGKKRLRERGKAKIEPAVFKELLKR